MEKSEKPLKTPNLTLNNTLIEPGGGVELIEYSISNIKAEVELIPAEEKLDPRELLAVQLLAIYLACVILIAIFKSIYDWIVGITFAPYVTNPFFWIYLSGIVVAMIGIVWGVRRLYKKYAPILRNKIKRNRHATSDLV